MGLAKTDRSLLNRRRSEAPARISAFGAALLLICASAALSGCAANSYAGISLAPGAADPEIQELARRAHSGDKHAQLALGIRYEEGQDVPLDLDRAEHLYRLASTDTGGTQQIYVPTSRAGGRAAIVPINAGRRVYGLREAHERLLMLILRRNRDR